MSEQNAADKTHAPDRVVLVHGTGAGDDAVRGDKWWQIGSEFERFLVGKLGEAALTVEPFRWSGANSERDRLAAAAALLKHLRKLEAAGVYYHLIGHSHGGSVIWSALSLSARSPRPLARLRGWATVGTPFLSFRAVAPGVWAWATLVVLALLMAAMSWSFGDIQEWAPLVEKEIREGLGLVNAPVDVAPGFGGHFQWRTLALLPLGVVGWLVLARPVFEVAVSLWRSLVVDGIDAAAQRRAAQLYGDRWLGLWHPQDEPINGLAGTLGDAPQIAPRIRHEGWYGWIPGVGPFANRVLARAADQFAWLQMVRRIQGTDIRGYRLVAVGRAPRPLQPGFEQLPPKIAEAICASADDQAGETAGRVRDVLEAAYDVQSSDVIFSRATMALSFQELVHTSYFSHEWVRSALALHLRARLSHGARPPALRERGFAPARARAPVQEVAPTRHFLALDFVRRASFQILPALMLAALVFAWFANRVAPRTETHAIAQIAKALKDPAKSNAGDNEGVAEVLVKLHELGSLKDPIETLLGMEDNRVKLPGLGVMARYFARNGLFSQVEVTLGLDIIPFEAQAAKQSELLAAAFENGVLPSARDTIERGALRSLIDRSMRDLPDVNERGVDFLLAATSGDAPRRLSLMKALLSRYHLLAYACGKMDHVADSDARDAAGCAEPDLEPGPFQADGLGAETISAAVADVPALLTPDDMARLDARAIVKAALTFNREAFRSSGQTRSWRQRLEASRELRRLQKDMEALLFNVVRQGNDALVASILEEVDVLTSPEHPLRTLARLRVIEVVSRLIDRDVAISKDAFVREVGIDMAAKRILASPPSDTAMKMTPEQVGLMAPNLIWPGVQPAIILLKRVDLPNVARYAFANALAQYRKSEDKAIAALGAITLYNIATYTGLDDPRFTEAALRVATEALSFDKDNWWQEDAARNFIFAAVGVAEAVGNVAAVPPNLRRLANQAVDSAERGLPFVEGASRRVDLTRQVANRRAQLRDFRRARLLVERTNDPAMIMATYGVILDEIIKSRAERKSPGPQPRHPTRLAVNLPEP